ncbi:MAG: hypothetical protein EBT71_08005, partial [Alphaproteobacteria bacterium]|nr:hypothetical protein [Alphaproteobacteria bacterium]
MEIIFDGVLFKTLNLQIIQLRIGEEHTIRRDALLHMVNIQRPISIQFFHHANAEPAIGRVIEIIFHQR